MDGQLRKLRNGIHRKTGVSLPPAVDLEPFVPPTRSHEGEEVHKQPEGFYEYVPASFPAAMPAESGRGPSTSDRQRALLERIRAKERANASVPTCAAGSTAYQCTTNDNSDDVVSRNKHFGDPPGISELASFTPDESSGLEATEQDLSSAKGIGTRGTCVTFV